MPVILRFGRFKFVIYPQDHRPAHVHVLAAEAEAKFEIETGRCIASVGFTQKTVGRLSQLVLQHKNTLLEAWRDNDGQE